MCYNTFGFSFGSQNYYLNKNFKKVTFVKIIVLGFHKENQLCY